MATIGGSAPYAVTQRSAVAGSTANPTTTSTSYVTLPDMTITMTTAGGDLLCWGAASMSNATTGDSILLGLSLDGATPAGGESVNANTTGATVPVAVCWCFTGVSAGSHTVTLKWAVGGGTGTAFGTYRSLVVEEVRR